MRHVHAIRKNAPPWNIFIQGGSHATALMVREKVLVASSACDGDDSLELLDKKYSFIKLWYQQLPIAVVRKSLSM
jgi:hypothetical protein